MLRDVQFVAFAQVSDLGAGALIIRRSVVRVQPAPPRLCTPEAVSGSTTRRPALFRQQPGRRRTSIFERHSRLQARLGEHWIIREKLDKNEADTRSGLTSRPGRGKVEERADELHRTASHPARVPPS
jgi:hypothetical protein